MFAAAQPVGLTQVLGTAQSMHTTLGFLLLGAAALLAASLVKFVPPFRRVSRFRAALGIPFFYGLAAVPLLLATRAVISGKILLGKRHAPDVTFNLVTEPFGFWATFALYLMLCTAFMTLAFYYTGHALRIWRGRA